MTAGPTREYFDPVRFLSNPSSGKMGYAIAQAAAKAGAHVTLISGPTSVTLPRPLRDRVKILKVVSAKEMYRAAMKQAPKAGTIFMVAAVSDWTSYRYSPRKLKKRQSRSRSVMLRLRRTPDILEALGRRKKRGQILVGFAAETERLVANARQKLIHKNLDFIVANLVGPKAGNSGFESDRCRLVVIPRIGMVKKFPPLTKSKAAVRLIKFVI